MAKKKIVDREETDRVKVAEVRKGIGVYRKVRGPKGTGNRKEGAIKCERERSNEEEKWKHWCNKGDVEKVERAEGGKRRGRSFQEQ